MNNNYIYLVPKDELLHYGVKGMKWGVRKYSKSEAKRIYKSDKKEAYKTFKKTTDDLKKTGRENDVQAVKKATAKYNADRKAAKAAYKSNRKEKISIKESIERRDARVKETAQKSGYLGTLKTTAAGQLRYSKNNAIRGTVASVLNTAANAYISSSNGSYRTKVGVDYVRKAGIGALSIVDHADKIMHYRDVGRSLYYASGGDR